MNNFMLAALFVTAAAATRLQLPSTVITELQPDAEACQVRSLSAAQRFGVWALQHGKDYKSADEVARRQAIWDQNLQFIEASNSRQDAFQLALNSYADLTWDEFRSTRLGLLPVNGSFRATQNTAFSHGDAVASDEVDWVKAGAVTPVKNQAFCGSCWAFSTTGSIEGINQIYSGGKVVSLSEQELVDCDVKQDMGCNGGLMDYAFGYVIKNGGLDTEADYSYWSVGGICNHLREDRKVVSIDGYEDVPPNDEAALQKAVTKQPVSVAICADPSLQFYSSGILADKCCTALDHGVLVVGYGEEAGVPYYTVKNSWGQGWGENGGYFRLKRDVEAKEGQCGIAMAASYPIKTSPNPSDIPEVCGWFGAHECKPGTTCSCAMSFLNLFCLQWGCAERSV